MTQRVLVLLSHPSYSNSVVNRRLIEVAQGVEGVTCRHLEAIYPQFEIDVEAEQQLVREHDALVFQHPLYWYSSPPHLKLWIDQVLLRDFAFGRRDPETKGKTLRSVVSAGGPESAYAAEGFNGYPIKDFLRAFERTAIFCRMKWEAPLILHNTYGADEAEIDAHVDAYQTCLREMVGAPR